MAGRRFVVADVVEVLEHWRAGATVRHLAQSLGMGRGRVKRIVRAASAAGLTPGGPPRTVQEWEAAVPAVFAPRPLPVTTEQRLTLEQFHDAVVEGLRSNTATTVWQRLRDEQGLVVSLSTFRRYVRDRIQAVSPDRATVRKPPTKPGEVAEVDYGLMGMWLDPIAQKLRRMYAFIMTLPMSGQIFVEIVDRCDQESWVASNVAAITFFSGSPITIRLDNLRTGVLRADIYDPQVNRSYAEFGRHAGILIDPCRKAKPKDRPHVERMVPYVRDSFWRGRQFGSRMEIREAALRWCSGVSRERRHQRLPMTVGEVFETIEKPALLALPDEPFEVVRWAKAKLHPDCHCQVDRIRYTASWRFIGRELDVRVGERVVRIYHEGELLRTHVRERGKRVYTNDDDYPPAKVAFLLKTPAWCRRRAAEAGPSVTELVAGLLPEVHPLGHLRQAQAVLRLADTYGATRLDAACRMALSADASYRTVANILKKALDAVPPGEAHVSEAGAFLHGQQLLLADVSS